MGKIHPTAIVDPKAQIGENVEIGAFSTINQDVIIGDNVSIGTGTYVDSGTRISSNCKVGHYSLLGLAPQDLKYKNEKTYLEIGEGTIVREFSTLHRGTTYHYKSVIGKNCFIMTYVHIAHDCLIGDNVIIANAVNMGGHVEIDSHATVGGLTAIHQFIKIGQHAFVGGGLRINKDIPPYIRVMGDPARYGGTNYVGLERKGFSKETILEIKRAYRFIYQSSDTVSEAAKRIKKELQSLPEIQQILEFINRSDRGIIRGQD
ncbi:MAG: acyl-ACP--UDP-N-acetylglucosamine O-acyltransferase [bacterium]|nr:MAG: acyl-ACP--UDP-N-acetylglucosamine O-acyltransferase [bacterium]